MSETLHHPSPERLHGYVEEDLDEAGRTLVGRHLDACSACRTEVEELRSLFAAFRELPSLAPSTGFADRVMARVRVRRRVFAWAEWSEWASGRAAEWAAVLGRMLPQTTRGWAAAAGVFALPVVATTVLVWWLMSQPGVSPQTLWMVASGVTGEALSAGWQWLSARLVESTAAGYVSRVVGLAGSVGRGEIGLVVVMFATATAASVYVLYQNLFRTNARRTQHASYVF